MSKMARNSILSAQSAPAVAKVAPEVFGAAAWRGNGRKHHARASVALPEGLLERLTVPQAFAPLFRPARYKVFYGGRGGGKSWAFADALLLFALAFSLRILCARELQVSIADSVHRLLADRISARGLEKFFTVTKTGITGRNGSEFIFKGLRHNVSEIKSLEGVDICWVEEAQRVSQESWDLLIPTIRAEGSEIWISFNPGGPDDPTWTQFVVNPRPGSVVVRVGWRDNPYFSATLNRERLDCLKTDPEKYRWIWDGEPRVITEAQVFGGKWAVEDFTPPAACRWFYGADWGFAADPTVLVRAFVRDNTLFVADEAWAKGLELEGLDGLFAQVPDSRRWAIRADNSRPEIIRSLRRRGWIVKPCKKWPGSIEEGIAVLRGFARIVVHPRCVHMAEEMRLYSYKTDPLTGEVLPQLIDKNNHCVDALRYALEPVIRNKVGKLGKEAARG